MVSEIPKPVIAPRNQWFALNSPIGVVGGFTALSEVAAIIAATLTDGGIQWLLTGFAVVFPVLVFAAFFVVLWNRPEVLYPPKEYGTITVGEFAEQMRKRSTLQADVSELRRSVLTGRRERTRELVRELPAHLSHNAANVPERGASAASDESASVDLPDVFLHLRLWSSTTGEMIVKPLPVVPSMTVDEFIFESTMVLLDVDSGLPDFLEVVAVAESYGLSWAWKDIATGKVFTRMGPGLKRFRADTRRVTGLGLTPGKVLVAVDVPLERSDVDGSARPRSTDSKSAEPS